MNETGRTPRNGDDTPSRVISLVDMVLDGITFDTVTLDTVTPPTSGRKEPARRFQSPDRNLESSAHPFESSARLLE